MREVVHADDWDEGMGASLRAGLAHLEQGDDDLALVTLVDLPDVTAEVVRRVLAAAQGDGRGGAGAGGLRRRAGPPGGHRPRPLGRRCVATARGDRGARDHLRATPHHLVECGDLATGRDLDTAGDLDDLRRGRGAAIRVSRTCPWPSRSLAGTVLTSRSTRCIGELLRPPRLVRVRFRIGTSSGMLAPWTRGRRSARRTT